MLTIRRADNGTWELPGGVLELSEAPEDGVRREVYEETGIKVQVDRLTGVYKNTARGIVALVFRCHAEGGQEQLSEESTAARHHTRGRRSNWLVLGRVSNVLVASATASADDPKSHAIFAQSCWDQSL
ncbi:NUDIX domain-containing protein [Streptomyces sp. NBC_00842]|uniref:NUDIX domain-containing protein n=1 Tax=unclassified Streptomyces TaxID=2593676 RepID=UPI00386B1F99